MEKVSVHSVDNLLSDQVKQLSLDKEEVEFLIKESNSIHVKNMLNDYNMNLQQILKDVEFKLKQHSIKVDDKEEFISITKYSWIDNKKNVKIYVSDLFSDNLKINTDNIKAVFNISSIDVKLYNINGKNYRLNLKDLNSDYDNENSSVKLTSNGFNVTLKKLKEESWHRLVIG